MGYPAETLVLTPDGWKKIHKVELSDRIAHLHEDEIVFSQPLDMASKSFNGDLRFVHGRNYGFIVTPDHVFAVRSSVSGACRRVTAATLPTSPSWQFRSNACMARRDREVRDLKFAQLVGVIRSSRHILTRRHITVLLKLGSIKPYFITLLQNAGVQFTLSGRRFTVERHPRIISYFSENKWLRRSTLLGLDCESRRMFVQGAMSWNLRVRTPSFPTQIARMWPDDREIVHELSALSGLSCVEREADNGWIYLKIRPNDWNIIPKTSSMVPYSGRTYSLSMPSGTLLTRSPDKPAVVGDGWGVLDGDEVKVNSKKDNRKLTVPEVREIKKRLANGEHYKDIAEDYAMSVGCIEAISAGRNWRHVT